MATEEARIYFSILAFTLILGAIIFAFFSSIVRQHRKNMALQRENRQIEVNALEEERRRVSADLHDELAPMLAAVKMGINNLPMEMNADRADLLKTNQTIDNLSKRMREISFNLMPSTLLRKGLQGALEELTGFINKGGSMVVQLYVDDMENLHLTEEKQLNIYRVVQEIVHNTVKHAKATKLKIKVYEDSGKLILATIDNGVGFDYEKQVVDGGGIGLKSIRSRIDLLNGDVEVESEPGKGTTYTIEIQI